MNALKRELLTNGWLLAVVDDKQAPESATCIADIKKAGINIINAVVPGNFELDLMREGILSDVYVGDGILELCKYETSHVYYSLTFNRDKISDDKEFILFEGVDTIADVYLNGKLLGECDNMMIEHRFPATSVRTGENELFVHIKPISLEARNIPYTLGVSTQNYNYETGVIRKPPHALGWDLAPRAVSAGIWKDVYYETLSTPNIKETYMFALAYDKETGIGEVQFRYDTDIGHDSVFDYKISISGKCGESEFFEEKTMFFPTGKIHFLINNCKQWNMRGRGEPNLYDVVVTLKKNDEVVDTKSFRFGHRTVSHINSEILDENDNGTFKFIVNGEPVYIMGTNWVAADMFHSKDKERVADIVKLAYDCGCNAIRCWGGNVYENDLFYDLCDEYGIFVWQDFTMACAYYPQDERMQKLIAIEAEAVVKRLRQHPCVCLWSGDNEVDIEVSYFRLRDPYNNVLTRTVIPEVIKNHDAEMRPYLPSSPYISEKTIETFKDNREYKAFVNDLLEKTTEQHLWSNRPFYKDPYYTETKACFVSEIGYPGCASPDTIRKFADADHQYLDDNNPQWKLHSGSPTLEDTDFNYRLRIMTDHNSRLFADKPIGLDEFARMNQIVQAESLKNCIEMFRIRKGHTSGLMWWNLMDCWPESSDSVVDYYFVKKLAFSYITASQQQFCIAMDDKDGKLTVYALNDYPCDIAFTYRIIDANTGLEVASGKSSAIADISINILELEKPSENKFYKIIWDIENVDVEIKAGTNHYLYYKSLVSYEWYRECMKVMDNYQFNGFSK